MSAKSSLTEVRRTQIVTLRSEGYTERDIAANLRCSETEVHNNIVKLNADGMFHDKRRFGRPRKTMSRYYRSVRRIVMGSPKCVCKSIRAILRLKGAAISSSTVSRCLSK